MYGHPQDQRKHLADFARTLERELALASAKVAEGEADRERLDWLATGKGGDCAFDYLQEASQNQGLSRQIIDAHRVRRTQETTQ